MSSINKLNFTICKDNNTWFVLENVDMEQGNFSRFVNSFEKAFIEAYGPAGALDYVKKVEKDGKLVMFVEEIKVPHVAKILINNKILDIEINLSGITNEKCYEEDIIKKPFDVNKVKRLVSFYNVNTQKNINKKSM